MAFCKHSRRERLLSALVIGFTSSMRHGSKLQLWQMKRRVEQTYKTQPFQIVIRLSRINAPYKYYLLLPGLVVTAHSSNQQTPDKNMYSGT